MAEPLGWRAGFELELLAPAGRTRRDLADAFAGDGGQVVPYFHPQSEPSLVPGMKAFETLTLGFRSVDASGSVVACCVDDVTLRDRLDPAAPPIAGWYRIVSDDHRFLHLVRRHGPADQGLEAALAPVAELYGTALHRHEGMVKVTDELGAPICIGAPVPGERQRPCEVVTPPLAPDCDVEAVLGRLLRTARRMGFSVPAEAAVHVHLESAPLHSAHAIANLVELTTTWGPALKGWVRTNPRCVRLGPHPDALLQTVRAPGFRALSWPEAQARLAAIGLSKYVDVNLKNVAHPRADKPTVEFRILPGAIQAGPVVRAARVLVALCRRALGEPVAPLAPQADIEGLWPLLGIEAPT